MLSRWRCGIRLSLMVLAALGLPGASGRAQNFGSPPVRVPIDGPAVPQISRDGAWGEVIMANAKWLVLQDGQGQQIPISMDSVGRFLIRWPTNANALSPQSVVEAIGPDLNNNSLMTDHVDVFEGADQALVRPTMNRLLGNNQVLTAIDPTSNRMMTAWDIGQQSSLYAFAFPVAAGDTGNPARLHVVGNVVGLNPLTLSAPGNALATVVPPPSGTMMIYQVTRGTSSFAQKGDMAFVIPMGQTPKSLVLSQLVLLKRIPLNQFAAP